MHRVTSKLNGIFAFLLIVATGVPQLSAKNVDWDLFSSGIKMACASPNHGLQKSALRMIIKYGPKLDIEDAVDDITRIYLKQEDKDTKKLALLALYQIDKSRALTLVQISFEDDSKLIRQEISRIYSR